jgi:hypothetical protein
VSAALGLALTAGLLGLPAAQAAEPVTAPTIQPAAPTLQKTTATLQQLLDKAAVVKPITIGYRASKFITPAQRAKKDKFGCNLNKQTSTNLGLKQMSGKKKLHLQQAIITFLSAIK